MLRFGVLVALILVRLLTPPVCFCHCHSEQNSHEGGLRPHFHTHQLPFLDSEDDEPDGAAPVSDAIEVSDDFYLGTVSSEFAKTPLPGIWLMPSVESISHIGNASATVVQPPFHDTGPHLILDCLTSVQILQ